MGLWVQFFIVLNGGLIAGAIAAATMRYALLWASGVDRRAALADAPGRPRPAASGPRSASPASDASATAEAVAAGAPASAEPSVATSAEEEAQIAAAMEMPAPDLDLPEEWLETLAAQGIVARTCFEAVVHILRLEVGAYREALCTVEDRLRMTRSGDAAKLRSTLNDGESVIRIWFERQETALAILKHAAAEEAESPKHGAVMRMLQFQVDRHTELLQQLTPAGARREGAELRELGSTTVRECLAMVHRLRDWVMTEIAELLREQGRLEALPDRAALDGATSIFNRVGLERAYQEWQGVNPNGDRPAALAVIHVDEFDRVNALLGTRAAELALRAFAELGRSILRRNRGFDCVGRGGGVDLVVILGDTPSRQAISVVERLRQTIEESEFRAGPLTFNLTVSSCVGECDVKSPLAPQIDRIAKNVRAAGIRFGRNRTFVEGERGTEEVEAPPMSIKPKTVLLGSSIEIKEKTVE